jgi:broad specificity phosphatase PhoE
MATRTIYLLRHGYHDLESAHKLGGGLTSTGVEQAQLTAQRFSPLPISAIYCSTLRRAVETAEIVAQEFPDVPLRRSQDLGECVPCVPPAYAEHFADLSPQDLAWGRRQAEKAFARYFRRTRGEDRHEIIVTHGNLIRYFVCRVLQVSPKAWGNMDLCNCGISQVLIQSDGRMILVSHNDFSHLPGHLVTSLVGEELAQTLHGLAQVALDRGDLAEARQRGRESLAILERIKHESAARVQAWLDGLPDAPDQITE